MIPISNRGIKGIYTLRIGYPNDIYSASDSSRSMFTKYDEAHLIPIFGHLLRDEKPQRKITPDMISTMNMKHSGS